MEVISRDRAGAYAEGARLGAPTATQVADRWHLLRNAGDVLEAVLSRSYAGICSSLRLARAQTAADARPAASASQQPAPVATADPLRPPVKRSPPARTRDERRSQARRTERLTRYQAVWALRQAGVCQAAIADQLGLYRDTVHKYLRHPVFPERVVRPARPSQLDAYKPYLRERWLAGCHVGVRLWHELVAQGYRGGRTIVYRFVAQLRHEAGLPLRRQRGANGQFPDKAARLPTVRQLKWLLLRSPSTLTTEEHGLVEQVCHSSREVTLAYGVLLDFGTIVRERQRGDLSNWVSVATASDVPELQGFAQGVIRDYAAVRAALELPWSTGPVEGQIHRLKLLKRQMYGRAKLDLLRVRVLQA